VTDDKHVSEETVEESAARVEPDTDSDTTTETPAKHAAPEATEPAEETEPVEQAPISTPTKTKRKTDWSRVVAFAVLPVLAFLLALGAAFLKFVDLAVRESNTARTESVQAATDTTVAMLSYKPDTVEKQLTEARSRLTGQFLDQYTELTTNVVIPGAKQKQISAVAYVPRMDDEPAAASVSADPAHAVVLVFMNQTVTVGNGVPADTASSVRVTLDKVGDRWLISQFDPV
jgi:Mce-associated membrane protein